MLFIFIFLKAFTVHLTLFVLTIAQRGLDFLLYALLMICQGEVKLHFIMNGI